MQKLVAFVLCMTLVASTQAFIGGNDGLGGLMFYNMMSGRPLLDFNLFGMGSGGSSSAATQSTGQRGTAAQPARAGRRGGLNLISLALLNEVGMF